MGSRYIGNIYVHQQVLLFSLSVMSDSLPPHGLWPSRLLCPWHSPGKNTGVGSLSLLQRIFPTQESNQGLLRGRQVLYQLSHQGSPTNSAEADLLGAGVRAAAPVPGSVSPGGPARPPHSSDTLGWGLPSTAGSASSRLGKDSSPAHERLSAGRTEGSDTAFTFSFV